MNYEKLLEIVKKEVYAREFKTEKVTAGAVASILISKIIIFIQVFVLLWIVL
ncbi:hypothetical protein [Mesoplasma tabanidae]|uniref:hypothetical protein n=1 Tax=Mesoplasma tabanidae TaxID=219745 RepID=UPI00142E7094|nr:hypothetical protein [Mesoplasma tabanidae]